MVHCKYVVLVLSYIFELVADSLRAPAYAYHYHTSKQCDVNASLQIDSSPGVCNGVGVLRGSPYDAFICLNSAGEQYCPLLILHLGWLFFALLGLLFCRLLA